MELPRNRLLRGSCLMARRYLRHNVGIQSAALAFYLLFMLFPFLIFISALLGLLRLDVEAILVWLGQLLPREVVDLAEMYLLHVTRNSSPQLLLFGLFFSIYFPMRAANSLMRAVRTAYHLGPPRRPIVHTFKSFLYTVVLILVIAVTMTLLSVTDAALHYAMVHFGLPAAAAALWNRLRFPVVAAVAFFAIFGLYALSQDSRQPWRNIWPGALCALGAWMGMSLLYTLYVENFANYSLVYGSIGTVIVVLIWLYASAMVLIMGAELNGTLMALRKDSGG